MLLEELFPEAARPSLAYLILYRLVDGVRGDLTYDDRYKALTNEIKKLQPVHLATGPEDGHISTSAWLVKSLKPPQQLLTDLKRHIRSGDRVDVVEVTLGNVYTHVPK